MKPDRTKRDAPRETSPPSAASTDEVVARAEPLKPRRGLFAGLFLFFLVWVGMLLTMWFFTVRPKG